MEIQNRLELENILHDKLKSDSSIQQWTTEIAKAAVKYRPTNMAEAYVLSLQVAALMQRESAGGLFLSPRGPTGTGDVGHGRGLMQIDDRSHQDKLALKMPDGSLKWQNAFENICMGIEIFQLCLDAVGGDVKKAACAYNAGAGAVQHAIANGKDPDSVTTPGPAGADGVRHPDYGSDILKRIAKFST
jgi:hypothetical protein